VSTLLDLYKANDNCSIVLLKQTLLGGEIFGRHTSLSRWRRIWETRSGL